MFSVKIKNYKCFSSEQGFEEIKRINIIIGKNNIGKSTLLDIIHFSTTTTTYQAPDITWNKGSKPQLIFKSTIPESVITKVFDNSRSGGQIPMNHREYGLKLLGCEIGWIINQGEHKKEFLYCKDNDVRPNLSTLKEFIKRIIELMPTPLNGKKFKKLNAERDIQPETDRNNIQNLSASGDGATSIIQSFINKIKYSSELIEKDLLDRLNEVYNPDAIFTDIVCQQYDDAKWEIFLEEDNKGRIPLSKSGSSLKTVILVLIYLIIIPQIEGCSLSSYIFAFEELENNLHPSLLRRLIKLIDKLSQENNFTFFLTTHSNVMINLFSKNKDAQIIHVIKENNEIKCNRVITYIDSNGILDDLDINASDLLQSNGIIWVEGPSDRIYINKWIEIWSNNKIEEGIHYQCMFYGGRLLSHLDCDEPKILKETISLLNINRNSMMILDSDKREKNDTLNSTKTRLLSELDGMNLNYWVTECREIENYIPIKVFNKILDKEINIDIGQYDSIFDKLDEIVPSIGKKYQRKKTLFAEKVIPFLNHDLLKDRYDLNEKMNKVISEVCKWNKLTI